MSRMHKNIIETPTCFEDLEGSNSFFILGEGEQANLLHAILAGQYGTKFYGYLSSRNSQAKTDTKTSYPVHLANEYLVNIQEDDFIFLVGRSEEIETKLLNKGARLGYSYFFIHTILTYETPTFSYFLRTYFLRNETKSIALDVGANFGITSAMMSSYFTEIHAFEPHGKIFQSLQNNQMLPKNIILDNRAFGEHEGKLDFFGSADNGNGSLKEVLFEGGEKYRVDVTTVDQYCETNGIQPKLIKIDAEGTDLNIIRGAERTIEQCKPFLYFENPVVSPLTYDEEEWLTIQSYLKKHYHLKAFPSLHQPFPNKLLGDDYNHFINSCKLKSPLNIAAIPK